MSELPAYSNTAGDAEKNIGVVNAYDEKKTSETEGSVNVDVAPGEDGAIEFAENNELK
jgi:hypothetical protein